MNDERQQVFHDSARRVGRVADGGDRGAKFEDSAPAEALIHRHLAGSDDAV